MKISFSKYIGELVAGFLCVIGCLTPRVSVADPIVNVPGYQIERFATGAYALGGLAFGPSGDLFATDYGAGQILRVQSPFVGGLNAFELYATGFAFPGDLTFNASGRLFVTSNTSGTGDVREVFPDGHSSVFAIGLSFPTSIAAHGSDLYVSESGDGTIQRIDQTGALHTFLSGFSSPNGPYGISFDQLDNLYFTNHGTGAIYESDLSGNVQLLGTASQLGVGSTGIDGNGRLFVVDILAANLLRRDSSGLFSAFASNFEGKSHPPAVGPTDMAFDPAGNMYVGDGASIWKISAVPEPSAIVLGSCGLVTLALAFRGRRLASRRSSRDLEPCGPDLD